MVLMRRGVALSGRTSGVLAVIHRRHGSARAMACMAAGSAAMRRSTHWLLHCSMIRRLERIQIVRANRSQLPIGLPVHLVIPQKPRHRRLISDKRLWFRCGSINPGK